MVGHVGAPQIDIAVDPLSAEQLCRQPAAPSLCSLLLEGSIHAPIATWDKLAAGPTPDVSLDGGVAYSIEQAMHVLDCKTNDVRIVALDRERHMMCSRTFEQRSAASSPRGWRCIRRHLGRKKRRAV